MEVLVFKTSVQSLESVNQLSPLLNELAGNDRWNFALDDCDRVLRIVSGRVSAHDAIQLLLGAGFDCEELE
ncbi:MAG: hypothetical protein JNJ65_17710 [Cyclobacteriaceae bacterium]|nr:hypothetical protein [Cyclobacteriaceae bacterium]